MLGPIAATDWRAWGAVADVFTVPGGSTDRAKLDDELREPWTR